MIMLLSRWSMEMEMGMAMVMVMMANTCFEHGSANLDKGAISWRAVCGIAVRDDGVDTQQLELLP